ncbi:MAG: DUF5107 domain-containing protein [Bacteroidales bacterium]|nr:DUF5107 domain-containing protein [Bacteroidales bacterium]
MVRAWREVVTIPTYEVGKPEKNPLFLEKRVYQGSSGVVYPYPVIESISDEKTDKDYDAIWLENEYIKVMILPELGGRVQMAYDKIKERHFVYYNHVIKPALVGLAGPWISGGIEFNWPQHHRPSTYMPVDSKIVENEDGSVTVWVNEMERMFHQKGAAGFTLRPGCAYLEIQGRVSNPTSLPQTFLWWANPAVEVDDNYQSVFPPDVNAVFDHGKRAVSSFPIATGTYYKMDYSAGVDISNYKNIYVPTSYMAVNSKYDFEGGYENDTKGGMLHVASHHYSPGKKQWTWGNGDFGRAWDRNLTDETTSEEARKWHIHRKGFRPYIELMAGVYTENQPDFSWLMPYEEKQFVQYFMPYRDLGIVKQASKDFVMNIHQTAQQTVRLQVYSTSMKEVRLVLCSDGGEKYYDELVTLSPEEIFDKIIDVKGTAIDRLTFAICSPQHMEQSDGHCLFAGQPLLVWHAEPDEIRPVPDAAQAALPPAETKTNDQLYLTGLHLEQYRHATWSALDYYEEALRRDPDDVRCLNQTGLWYLRRGRFEKAEPYLRKAVKIWQKRNPNPYDGEAVFNLALVLKYLSRPQEAYDLFWKSTWNKAWADAGYFEAACISVSQGRLDDALDELDRSLVFNNLNHKARALKASVLRMMKRSDEMLRHCEESLKLDAFNYGCLFEKYQETNDNGVLEEMIGLMHGNVNNYHELALDYAQAGLWKEAEKVLTIPAVAESLVKDSPLTLYYLGWFKVNQGMIREASACFERAGKADSCCCFPNRLVDVIVLGLAKKFNPEGAMAPYYLGCLYYDKRQYDLAAENWEMSARLDPSFPTVWRNLALVRFNKQGRSQEALEYMERAFSLDEDDERVFMELDQLYKRLHRPHEERLAFLRKYPRLVERRDDLVLEEITLLNETGKYEEAMHILDSHVFHPWEGGEGKVPAQYQICRVELAKEALAGKKYDKAVRLLSECLDYPHHLGEGKLYGAQENDFNYLLGVAYDALGDDSKARECWEEATKGPQEPAAAMYYNDSKPDKIFYQGLALIRLGREGEARGRFNRLINYGKQHIYEKQAMDYFAVSLPDLLIWEESLDTKNLIHCKYMLALGYFGLGDTSHALKYLSEVEALDNNHQGIQQLRTLIDNRLV